MAAAGSGGYDPRRVLTDHYTSWRPELRRAVMKARPEFFTWPRSQQERYGACLPEEDYASLERALLAELFGRLYDTSAAASEAADRLNPDELQAWNETLLPLSGIGEDAFFLNECLAPGATILNFETLRDFDEDDYRLQESARSKDDPRHITRPYRGSLYLQWAHLFVDGQFTYGMLSMAAGYLYCELDKTGRDVLEQRIPHSYVPGKNHRKTEGDCWQWDMRMEANGQEDLLEELESRVWRYTRERYEALLTEFDGAGEPGVFLLHQSEPPELNTHFVFLNAATLASIRLRTFVKDCRAMQRTVGELASRLETERAALASFIELEHAELARTIDPKVTRFRKRAKVLITNGAFG
jgi:hypothetical protein